MSPALSLSLKKKNRNSWLDYRIYLQMDQILQKQQNLKLSAKEEQIVLSDQIMELTREDHSDIK